MRIKLHRVIGSTCAVAALMVVQPAYSAAPSQPMICFGNEPSWSLQLTEPGKARFATPDQPGVEYVGSETRLDPLSEQVWRGKPATGQGADLVAFLNHTACSDNMSDKTHPVTARVSLADHRALAGCCRVVAASAAPPPPAPIEGPTWWRLTALRGFDANALHGADGPVVARFQDGRVSGYSGCNRFFGGYTIDGERIVIDPLAGSMMMCAESAMALEHAFTSKLAGTFLYSVAGKVLTLASDSAPVLTFEAEPPPTLEGVTWEVTGFNNGRQAVISPLLDTKISLAFKDGMVTGTAGCNTFRATYTAGADSLAIGAAATTRMACPKDGVMLQEQQFLAALQSATTWSVERNVLDVHRADGERVVMARSRAN